MPPQLSIWPVLASRTIFVHPRLTLIEDTVRLPSGQETEWLRYADSGDIVAVICVDEARRVLVSFQYNPAPGRVVEEFPGGGIAPGETVEDGARRELMEEIGLYAHRIERIGAFLLNNRRWSGRCHVVVTTELEERRVREWLAARRLVALPACYHVSADRRATAEREKRACQVHTGPCRLQASPALIATLPRLQGAVDAIAASWSRRRESTRASSVSRP